MRRSGTLKLWPGVAEEAVAAKHISVRAGVFKDVDVHAVYARGKHLGVSWGPVWLERTHLRAVQVSRADRALGGERRGAASRRSSERRDC